MKGLLEALDKQGISFSISDEAKQYLSLNGFTPKYGARQISSVVRNQLRRPISKFIISGEVKKGSKVTANLEKEEVEWAFE
jgi:ATP-dependent Clp protease ATP-binding subunit ClpA